MRCASASAVGFLLLDKVLHRIVVRMVWGRRGSEGLRFKGLIRDKVEGSGFQVQEEGSRTLRSK